ncbi:hypothetical protein INT45_008463 [Circinella minor]|uniref:Uncharacterized protein n=1 Tax=Circinella minor TaxID=1195481 RepID=A0A8H7SBF8_9FUNG|nr:hypothetical protein INT45_008463 [Circinella minor]
MATLSNSDTYLNSLPHDRYDEEDIEHMDRISSHPTRETTLNMFRRRTNIEQQDTATTKTTTSRFSQQEKTEALSRSPIESKATPYHSSLNIPKFSSTLPSRASSMAASSNNQQKPRLRRSTTNFYNRCQQPASAIPQHQTIPETEVDNYNEEETETYKGTEKVSVDQNILFYQAIPRTTLEKGKWVKDQFFTAHSESEFSKNDVQETTPWLTTLHQYIEHSQKEILTKEKELLELRKELKLLEKVQAQAQEKINLHHTKEDHNDEKMEKNHDKQVNNKERSKEKLFLSLRKQAVNCINNIASYYKIK